jgi:hypothetical protein
LFRKENCGPTNDDLQVFFPPDPNIDVVISKETISMKDSIKYSINPSTLFPNYSLVMDPEMILGSLGDQLANHDDINHVNAIQEDAWKRLISS